MALFLKKSVLIIKTPNFGKEKMSDLVVYGNDFNFMPLPKITELEIDIFMKIISELKENRELEYSFIEFYFDFYHERHKSIMETQEAFYKLADNLLSFKVKYSVENRHYAFVCFEKLKLEYTDDGEPIMKIKAQEDFFDLIANLQLGFTQFELKEFIGIKGKYAKNLYRLLKQFRSTGFLKMQWEEFCNIMQIPTSYKISHIDQKILNPAIAELSVEPTLFDNKTTIFKNLTYKKVKDPKGRGRGGKVIGIEFYFTPEKNFIEAKETAEQEPKEKPKKISVTEKIYFETEQEKQEYLRNRYKRD